MEQTWDCIVVGAGAAGLSAALVLGRARQRTLVIDAGQQSNLPAHGIGGLLGHDGRAPAELYAMGRAELGAYPSVTVREGAVLGGRREAVGFELDLADGTTETGTRVLLATGMEYRKPAIDGIGPFWGRSVFHCPFCHGWEVRDQVLGVLDRGPTGHLRALLLREWSDDVTLFTNGPTELDEHQLHQLHAAGVVVDERLTESLEGDGDALATVVFVGGDRRACAGLVVPVTLHQRSPLAEQLGATTIAGPLAADAIEVDASGATGVPGLSAAGDTSITMPSVANAIAAGSTAAAMLVHGAVAERYGVDVHRPTEPPELEAFWEAHYGKHDQVWSGNPNDVLVSETAGLAPTSALDLGCGEGGDALWLAEHGWQVTGVDVSSTALERAAREAERRGLAGSIDWQQHDLRQSFPEGSFDLVSAFFFHSPVEIPREDVLRRAAAAVRPGGTLLIVGHGERPSWAPPHDGPEVHLPTPQQVLADLDLNLDEWEEPHLAEPQRDLVAPDGSPATIRDNVVRLVRRETSAAGSVTST